MGFPDDEDLPLILEAAYGADPFGDPNSYAFTDISDRLVRSSDIQIRTGRSPGAQSANAGACSFAVDNDDGDWSPLNAASSLFPYVRLGLPMRLRYRLAMATFSTAVSNSWGSTDDGYVWSLFGAGGTVAASNWNVAAGVGTHLVPVANANRATYLANIAVPDVEVSVTVSLAITDITGGNVEPANILLRGTGLSSFYTARVEITTAEAVQVKLYDPSSNLLASATVAGLTHTSSQALRVRAQIIGNFFAIKVWAAAGSEPAGWHATAVDDAVPVAGWIGISSGVASGNSNAPVTFSYDDLVVTVGRASGSVASMQPDFIPTTDGDPLSVTRVTLGGRLRQLTQNAKPLRSALFRTMAGISEGDFAPVAHWSLEDESGSTQFASAIAGHPAATFTGDVDPASYTDIVGSSALPTIADGGRITAVVPAYASTSAWQLQFVLPIPSAPASDVAYYDFDISPGVGSTIRKIRIRYFSPDIVQIAALDSAGADIASNGTSASYGTPLLWAVTQFVNAGNLLTVLGKYDENGFVSQTNISTAGAVGVVTGVTAYANSVNAGWSPGHWALYTDPAVVTTPNIGPNSVALGGHVGELPTTRLARLCREDRVAIDIVAGGSTQAMGPQPVGTFLELLQDCALVDGGWLGEAIDGFGLSYVPLAARINRSTDMTIDLATYRVTSGESASVLAPTYDDQGIVNEVTASRPDGSSATKDDAAHIALYGRYDAAVTVNVEADSQLADQASWRVNLGTADPRRYPNTPVNIHANATTLLMSWLGLRPGLSRIVRTGLPAKSGADDDDRMLDGYSETLRPRGWTGSYEGSPSAPLAVGVYGPDPGGVVTRYDSDDSTLNAGINSAVTSIAVAWTLLGWTHADGDFDINVGGERMTVTAISGSTSPQTFTVTRSVNGIVKAHSSGAKVSLWDAHRYAL